LSDQERYTLELFGQKFVLVTQDGDQKDLKNVADYYKNVIDELAAKFPERPLLDLAILAGLKITDELYALVKKNNKSGDFSGRIEDKKITEMIDTAIKRLEVSVNL
jgi:cell division protein ZapA (FtsZ GTPase activity inhibitor)